MKMNYNTILVALINIIVICSLLYILLVRRKRTTHSSFVRRIGRYIITAYLVFLFSSVIAMYFLPTKGLYEIEHRGQGYKEMLGYSEESLVKVVKDNKEIEKSGLYKNGAWTFNTSAKELFISVPKEVIVFIEKDRVMYNRIEAVSYIGRVILSDIDFTSSIKPRVVKLEGNILTVMEPLNYNIEKILFNKDFTVSPFLEKKSFRVGSGFSGSVGLNILYLKIPNDINIRGGQGKVNIIR